jgi:hypothetical protein
MVGAFVDFRWRGYEGGAKSTGYHFFESKGNRGRSLGIKMAQAIRPHVKKLGEKRVPMQGARIEQNKPLQFKKCTTTLEWNKIDNPKSKGRTNDRVGYFN